MASNKLDGLRRQIDSIDDRILDLLNERARVVIEVGKAKARQSGEFYVPKPGAGHLRAADRPERRPLSLGGHPPGFSGDHLCLPLPRTADEGRVFRPSGDLHPCGGHEAVRVLGPARPPAEHPGGFRRGAAGAGQLRCGAGGEFHRRGGLPHPRHVHGVRSADQCRGPAGDFPLSCFPAPAASRISEGSSPTRSRWPSAANGWRRTFPMFPSVDVGSTAMAAQTAAEDETAAAIASEMAASLYGSADRQGEDRGQSQQLHPLPGDRAQHLRAERAGQDLDHVQHQGRAGHPLPDAGTLQQARPQPLQDRKPAAEKKGLGIHLLSSIWRGISRRRTCAMPSRSCAEYCQFLKVLGSYPRAR